MKSEQVLLILIALLLLSSLMPDMYIWENRPLVIGIDTIFWEQPGTTDTGEWIRLLYDSSFIDTMLSICGDSIYIDTTDVDTIQRSIGLDSAEIMQVIRDTR